MPDNSKRQSSLSREIIAAKALEIADEIGIENVSMRNLAGALDKTAMALYRYYSSIDEIRSEAMALAFLDVDSTPIPGERWDDTLRRTTASIRAMYHRHPKANLALTAALGDSPALTAHTDKIYGLHVNQGIPTATLDKIWRIVDAFLTGFMFNESIEMNQPRNDARADVPVWDQAVSQAYSDTAFRDGMEIIISGIAAENGPEVWNWKTPEA